MHGLEARLRPDGNLIAYRAGHPTVEYVGIGRNGGDGSFLNAAIHETNGGIDDGHCRNADDYDGSGGTMPEEAVLTLAVPCVRRHRGRIITGMFKRFTVILLTIASLSMLSACAGVADVRMGPASDVRVEAVR